MLFGLVVTDRAYAAHATALLRAAVARGWDARCFLTDTGVLLLRDEAFVAHARSRPGTVASCKHSIELHAPEGLDLAALGGAVVIGGQFQGARLASAATAMLVL